MAFTWYTPDSILAPTNLPQILDSTGVAAEEVHANWNLVSIQQKLFGVVFDKTFCLQSGGQSALHWELPEKEEKVVAGQQIRFNTGATTNGYGKIYIVLWSDAALNTPTVGWQWQLLFDDD